MTTILYTAAHFCFCLIWFCLVQRPAFIAANRQAAGAPLRAADLRGVASAGLRTDLAASAYLTALPLLALTAHDLWPAYGVGWTLWPVEGLVALALALATVADTALYRYWQTKIDASVFAYLRHPAGAFASVTALYAVTAIMSVLLLASAAIAALMGLAWLCGVFAPVQYPSAGRVFAVIGLFLLGAALLFAAIRGLAHRPNSPGMTCRSPRPFINHCALNPVYNVIYTLSLREKKGNPFRRLPQDECDALVDSLFPRQGTPRQSLLRSPRPNVLVIVWESLCSHFVEAIGGKPGVTPCLDRLADEGVLFTNVTAGSWRTDPALVCVLSGMIAQPTGNIIRQDKKLPRLPALPRTLRDNGYNTALYHGGSLSYMNFAGYFIAAGHDTLLGRPDLPDDAPACSWGVHDGYMFDLLYREIAGPLAGRAPWYATFLTLSSHQPFKVPYARLTDPIDNAFAYTDHCLGEFVDKLKATPQWDDLLIVITGDHGINETSLGMTRAQSSHVPVVMLGGALNGPARFDMPMSQSDIAATLLGQMGIGHCHFPYSRDVLADTYTEPFGMHVYTNGFAVNDPQGFTDYDTAAGRATEGADPARERRGLAVLQSVYDYISRLAP